MTPTNAGQELSAGRELDALVAEFVMGDVEWDVVIEGCSRAGLRCATREEAEAQKPKLAERYLVGPVTLHGDVPEYSTDIAAAWLVVEELGPKHMITLRRTTGGWWAHIGLVDEWAETAPLAICRAALTAVEGECERTAIIHWHV